ncbi:MAG TPA: polysaccharide deacetylase family protein, partial [Planctomycetaceae bacterium]|nr:polysaccharide deacetylase family protein [Planctomycetaceae bacterium]
MALLRQLMKHTLTACLPAERWLVRGRTRQTNALPAISLTFDDGPHPTHTADVLAELDRWQLTATFFVIGQHAEAHPQLIQQIVAAGHTVANHTWTHSEPSLTSGRIFAEEVTRTTALVTKLTGTSPRWMRPPKGELTVGKTFGLWRAGYTIALWSVDPRDYRIDSDTEALAVSQQTAWSHGDIVLLHDNRLGAAQLLRAWGRDGRWSRCQTVPLSHWVPLRSREGEAPAE